MSKTGSVLAMIMFLVVGAACTRHQAREVSTDQFNITNIYKSAPGGMMWTSSWDTERKLGKTKDSKDSWFTMSNSTSSFYSVEDGNLVVSGRDPRMYVRDPALNRQWRDVEITMYFIRKSDDSTPYAGMVAVARSNHGATGSVEKNLCDSRGYGGRIRYDGNSDFEKESSHPANDSDSVKRIWPEGMPFDKWLGMKFAVYDLDENTVKLELWLDQTGGVNGGTWRKINETIDDGTFWGDKGCKKGIDPKMALTSNPHRLGSESDKPNVSVYFRSDNVNTKGLRYKWGSIREIEPV
jgi:hypothetical protein